RVLVAGDEQNRRDEMADGKGRPIALEDGQCNDCGHRHPIHRIDACDAAPQIMTQPIWAPDITLMDVEDDKSAEDEKEIDPGIAEGEEAFRRPIVSDILWQDQHPPGMIENDKTGGDAASNWTPSSLSDCL